MQRPRNPCTRKRLRWRGSRETSARSQSSATTLLALSFLAGKMSDARDLAREVLVISNEARSRWIGLCAFDIATALAAIEADWPFAARMRGAAEARVKSMRHCRDRADAAFLDALDHADPRVSVRTGISGSLRRRVRASGRCRRCRGSRVARCEPRPLGSGSLAELKLLHDRSKRPRANVTRIQTTRRRRVAAAVLRKLKGARASAYEHGVAPKPASSRNDRTRSG